MFRFKLRAALVSLTAIVALALPASALATNVTNWAIVQQNDPGASNTDLAPYAGVSTELFTWPSGYYVLQPQSLVYGYETFGVNLTYTLSSGSSLNYQWEFIRQPGAYVTQQIPASERVALYNTAIHQYLVDACTSGSGCIGRPIEADAINLYWSTTPSYEWQVAKGDNPTVPSYADLYDSIEQAYLIPWPPSSRLTWGGFMPPLKPAPTTSRPHCQCRHSL